ncbi:MAG: dioxygenase [Streptosporangiales bacterium]|nr:dioxygenase [Streptosporangiales bacterium]
MRRFPPYGAIGEVVVNARPLDRFLADAGPVSEGQPAWEPSDGPVPALYLGHGAPPLLDDEPWMGELFDWAQSMPKPAGVLIVSAHWEAAPPNLTSPLADTPLVYDFSGFDPHYYRLTYPTPGAGALAAQVRSVMPAGQPVYVHPDRGLDQGAWVPLTAMYPLGDVPVLQLSMPTLEPERLLRMGELLRPLREEGVLIVGSGFMTHGLPYLTLENMNGPGSPPAWSREFDAWAAAALAKGDVDTLAAFRDLAPGMPYAHPTIEHYSPIFVTLGAATTPGSPVETTVEGFWWGLSKRSFQVT